MSSPLSHLEMDALRELVSVGAAYAANALAGMLRGMQVSLDVPSVQVLSTEALSARVEQGDAIVIRLGVEKGLSARILIRLPAQDACHLAEMLLGKSWESWPLSAEAMGALSETGNILGSACLTALGRMTGLKLIPTVPFVRQVSKVIRLKEEIPFERGFVVVLEALLATREQRPLRCQLFLFPDPSGLKELFQRLGLR